VCKFELFLPTYQNTRHHIPENNCFGLRISQRDRRDVTSYTFLHTIGTEGTAASSLRVNNGISRFYRVSTYLPKHTAPLSPDSNLKRVCSQPHSITQQVTVFLPHKIDTFPNKFGAFLFQIFYAYYSEMSPAL